MAPGHSNVRWRYKQQQSPTRPLHARCMLHAATLPALGRYNSAQLERVTYENGAAWVKSSGRVHHSVAGLVDITCRHSRLSNPLTIMTLTYPYPYITPTQAPYPYPY